MTSTLENSGAVDGEIFKRDKVGRVRVTRARREALLDEYERGGTSGAQFADYVGIKYSTFASWLQKRRRRQRLGAGVSSQSGAPKSKTRTSVQWLEAIVEAGGKESSSGGTLRVHLPGGAYLNIGDGRQAGLAAVLLKNLGRLGATGC